MRRDQLISRFPTLYHMAEDGTWPSISSHGLLSTRALVDLFQPGDRLRHEILNVVRRDSITLDHPQHGAVVVRDQRPLKFLTECLDDDTTPQEYLDALNGRVFFWLTLERLRRLLGATLYRERAQTVLHIDTAALLTKHGDVVQLAPYNTGSMHVPYPHAPKRGKSIFVDLEAYPYERWLAKRNPGRALSS